MKCALFVAFFLCTVLCSNVEIEKNVHLGAPSGWVDLGAASPTQTLQVYIAIKQQNIKKLHDFLNDVSHPKSDNYGKYASLQEISDLIAPKHSSIVLIKKWLKEYGILTQQFLSNDWLQVTARVDQLNDLLSVRYHTFVHSATQTVVHRSLTNYQIPSSLSDSIDFISNVFRFPNLKDRKPLQSSLDFFVTPESIQSLYNITIPPSNTNIQAVASFLGQYYSSSDLSQFEEKFSLPQVPIAVTYGYNDESSPGVEASLDVQYLLGVGNCSVTTWVYSTNGTTPSQNEPFLEWLLSLSSYDTLPNLISMSYQDYEFTVSRDYAIRVCNEFAKHTATGVTFITGSGDWGVGCFDDYSCSNFSADFPSSCPYVISTGATTLRRTSNNQEIGVAFSSGGFSNYFEQPAYQALTIQNYLATAKNLPPQSFFNASGRAFPDVAAIGTSFAVVVEGKTMPVDGTSAATPTFGSILSLINSLRISSNLPTLGYALPFLYEAAAENELSFQDITSSQQQNQGCCGYSFDTEVGWDPYTGLGTPNSYILTQLALSSSFFPSFTHKDKSN